MFNISLFEKKIASTKILIKLLTPYPTLERIEKNAYFKVNLI